MANTTELTDYTINNTTWKLPSRYTNLTPLGQGAYGLVCSADDSVFGQKIAIKKIAMPFATNIHAKRTFREIKLLKHVNHDNIIRLTDLFTRASCPAELDDMDLKPGNLTVNENCELRIIDFGLARSEKEEMTGYVATRWYRAPEIMLKWMNYTKAVDIWSVACIVVEMYQHRALFPGSDHVNQLNRILDVAGFPSPNLMRQVNEDARTYLERNPNRPVRVNFTEYFHDIYARSPTAIDLISQMLQLDPNERLTCEAALEHPYLKTFHDVDDEPEGPIFDDNYEAKEYSVSDWRELIFKEIKSFEPPTDVDF